MQHKKMIICLVLGVLVPVLIAASVPAASAPQSGRTTGVPPVTVYVPYQYPYQNNYPNDTYYKRLLDQYQQENDQRISQIQQDIGSLDKDLQTVIDASKQEKIDTAQIARKLEAIERTLGNINGRMKNLEQTVAMQNVRIKRLAGRLNTDANVPTEPNSKNDPNK